MSDIYKKAFEQLVSALHSIPDALDVPSIVYAHTLHAQQMVLDSLKKPLPVRYFAIAQDGEGVPDVHEITEFNFRCLALEGAKVTYERSTVFENGVDQIELTVSTNDGLYIDDLELIK